MFKSEENKNNFDCPSIVFGKKAGLEGYAKFCRMDASDTNLQIIGDGPFAGNYVSLLSGPTLLGVSSDDVNDAAAGIGARAIRLTGIDQTGAEIQEIVLLNGQTQVTTTNQFQHVNYTAVIDSGNTNNNNGNIFVYANGQTVTAGVPQTSYHQVIIAGRGFAEIAALMVPVDKFLYNPQFVINSTASENKLLTLRFVAELFNPSSLSYTESIPFEVIVASGLQTYSVPSIGCLPPLSKLYILCSSSQASYVFLTLSSIRGDPEIYPNYRLPA